jgi:NADPH:quinone reductase-like Zn-dependent oxidoreductase
MRALVLSTPRGTASLTTLPLPTPSPTQLLIRVHSIALNPIDPLYTTHPLDTTTAERVIGSDFAGTIVSLPSSIPLNCSLRVGDSVAGFLQGACSINVLSGAFAEYCVCEWDLVWRVPMEMPLEEAFVWIDCGAGCVVSVGFAEPIWVARKRCW